MKNVLVRFSMAIVISQVDSEKIEFENVNYLFWVRLAKSIFSKMKVISIGLIGLINNYVFSKRILTKKLNLFETLFKEQLPTNSRFPAKILIYDFKKEIFCKNFFVEKI